MPAHVMAAAPILANRCNSSIYCRPGAPIQIRFAEVLSPSRAASEASPELRQKQAFGSQECLGHAELPFWE